MTQTVAPPSDKVIRQGIAQTIRNGLLKLYSTDVANAVLIHDHWLWGFNLGENAALLRVESGTETGKVHGWIIGLASVSRERPYGSGGSDSQGSYRFRKIGPNRRDILRHYRIWCYHQLDTGDYGTESESNSENRLADEIDAVADEFSLTPLLGIDNPHILGHEDIQYSPIDVYRFDDTQVNVAQGVLGVRLYRPLDLNQY